MPVLTVSKAGGCISAPHRLDGSEPIGILIGEMRAHGPCAKRKERSQDDAVAQFWLRLAGTVTKTISALPNPNSLTADEHIRMPS